MLDVYMHYPSARRCLSYNTRKYRVYSRHLKGNLQLHWMLLTHLVAQFQDLVIAILTGRRFKSSAYTTELLQPSGDVPKSLLTHAKLPKTAEKTACEALHRVYMRQRCQWRLTGGIMCVWCTHSVCYGFHCIPLGEGHFMGEWHCRGRHDHIIKGRRWCKST